MCGPSGHEFRPVAFEAQDAVCGTVWQGLRWSWPQAFQIARRQVELTDPRSRLSGRQPRFRCRNVRVGKSFFYSSISVQEFKMSSGSISKTKIYETMAWIAVFPFLVIWPFLSAFPIISLIGASAFDLTASLNLVFLATGFWSLAGVALIVLLLLRSEVRRQVRSLYGSNRGLLLGGYAAVWTVLYTIAAFANR
jgi:hypothetical protein